MRLGHRLVWVTGPALLLAAAGTLATGVVDDGELTLANMLVLSGPNVNGIGGLTYYQDALWTGDITTGAYGEQLTVHQVSPLDGTVIESNPVLGTEYPISPPTGAAYGPADTGFLTSYAPGTFGIAHLSSGTGPGWTVADVYDFQGPEPLIRAKGLAYDGQYLWQSHYAPDTGHLYAIDPATRQRVNDLRVDPYPEGLTWDGSHFYVSHNDLATGLAYVAKYDRGGMKVATYALPPEFSGMEHPLGDLAVDGGNLFGVLRQPLPQVGAIAHMALPASPAVPALPPGCLAHDTDVIAGIDYGGKSYLDAADAEGYEQLPVAASLRHTGTGSLVDVMGLARSYYDQDYDKVRNRIHAMAFGAYNEEALIGTGILTKAKTFQIDPSAVALPAGTPVDAKGTLTFEGRLQVFRESGESPLNADGLAANLVVSVVKKLAGGDQACFGGSVNLLGLDGAGEIDGVWAQALVLGDMRTADALAKAADICNEDGLAYIDLTGLEVIFRIPVLVGEVFEVDVQFAGRAYVPPDAEGLGAEVCFGETPILGLEYFPELDAFGYDDGYDGGVSMYMAETPAIPEPACGVVLAAGVVGLLARSRRGARRRRRENRRGS